MISSFTAKTDHLGMITAVRPCDSTKQALAPVVIVGNGVSNAAVSLKLCFGTISLLCSLGTNWSHRMCLVHVAILASGSLFQDAS